MTNHSENFSNNTEKNDKELLNTSRFKENTHNTRLLVDKSIEMLSADKEYSSEGKIYRLTMSEYDTSDGYCVEYSKNIELFDFSMILFEIFGIDLDEYEDFSTYPESEEDVMVFNSIEEVIDYLKDKKDND